jgi:hypothetical protein
MCGGPDCRTLLAEIDLRRIASWSCDEEAGDRGLCAGSAAGVGPSKHAPPGWGRAILQTLNQSGPKGCGSGAPGAAHRPEGGL